MKKNVTMIILLLSYMAYAATFPQVKTQNAEGDEFIFPQDAIQEGPALFALAMSTNRKNGEVQQAELIAWQEYFNAHEERTYQLKVYHFPVLASIPFFVKGAIRKGIGKSYENLVPKERVAILFISDVENFADQAGIPLDEQSTLVLVKEQGEIAGYIKGPPTEENLDALQKLIWTLQ